MKSSVPIFLPRIQPRNFVAGGTLKPVKSGMRVTFLGTSDGHTSVTRDHSGILMETREDTLLLDCGAAAARFLLKTGRSPDVPSALWISHLHSDHIGQFTSLIQSLWLRGRREALTIYAPASAIAFLRQLLVQCLLFPELIGFPIVWEGINARRKFRHGPFTLVAFGTRHLRNLGNYFRRLHPQACFECYGVVVTFRGSKYVYSADIEHPRDLRPALRTPVKALLCELTHFPQEELFKEMSGRKVESVWITHYPDALIQAEKELRSTAKRLKYSGEVHLMRDQESLGCA